MTTDNKTGSFCRRLRREFLWQSAGGFGAVVLSTLLGRDGFGSSSANAAGPTGNPLAEKAPHFAPKAKSVIFLFMYGGPSHIDTFDYKPSMVGMDGKTVDVKTFGRGGHRNQGRIVEPRWKFKQYGECGKWVSDLFPNLAERVDDIAFLHSMTADSPIHGSAMLMMNSGKILSGSPASLAWVNYGLGTVNENLPGFVVMLDPTGGPISGAKNWSSGDTRSCIKVRCSAVPESNSNCNPMQRSDAVCSARCSILFMPSINGTWRAIPKMMIYRCIASYELAYKMQEHAPEAVNVSEEDAETLELYGVNDAKTQDFGRRCLIARRLVERGVRCIQLYSGGSHNDDNWTRTAIWKRITTSMPERRISPWQRRSKT